MIENKTATMSTNPKTLSPSEIKQLKANLADQARTDNREYKDSNDELIKFCESIPKKPTGNSIFEKNRDKYINYLAKKGTIEGIMGANKDSTAEDITEEDSTAEDITEEDSTAEDSTKGNNNLSIEELVAAFKAEMNIFKYLMSKHKNSRALAFVDIIVEQTYVLWRKKCQEKIDKAIKKHTIKKCKTLIDVTKNYDNNYHIITRQTANEYLDTIPKYQDKNEFYRNKSGGRRFVETWYGITQKGQCITDFRKKPKDNVKPEDYVEMEINGKKIYAKPEDVVEINGKKIYVEPVEYVEIDGKKFYDMKGIFNYHRGIQRGINVLREAAKKHRHTRGNIFADEFKKIVKASQEVLNLACSDHTKLFVK